MVELKNDNRPRDCTSQMTARVMMPPVSVSCSKRQSWRGIMKSCLEEYKDCDVNDIAEKYIEGQPQVSAVPVLPDEGGTVISGMDTEDKSVREGTVTYDIPLPRHRSRLRGTNCPHHQREAQNDFYPGYPLIKRGIYYC